MKKKSRKMIISILTFAACLVFLTSIALAQGEIGISLPAVSVIVTGEPQEVPETFEILLEAEDSSSPMPEGSENGAYKAYVKGGDMKTLPTIRFSSVGIYRYKIRQIPGTNELGVYDDSVYHITIYIVNIIGENGLDGLESSVIIRRNDEVEKLDYIDFKNEYLVEIPEEEIPGGEIEDPTPTPLPTPTPTPGEIEIPEEEIPGGGVPKTGDDFLIWPYIVSFIGAGILLTVLILTGKKKVKE